MAAKLTALQQRILDRLAAGESLAHVEHRYYRDPIRGIDHFSKVGFFVGDEKVNAGTVQALLDRGLIREGGVLITGDTKVTTMELVPVTAL